MVYRFPKPEVVELECPFCGKQTIKALYYPPVLQAKSSRCSAGRKTKFYIKGERYEILSGCSACGKSLKDVRRAFKKGERKVPQERVVEKLRELGLSAVREVKTTEML